VEVGTTLAGVSGKVWALAFPAVSSQALPSQDGQGAEVMTMLIRRQGCDLHLLVD
jgi:hypothetical protein